MVNIERFFLFVFLNLILLIPLNLMANIPTGESLFRNVSNANITNSLISVSFVLREIAGNELEKSKENLEIISKVNDPSALSIKILFYIDRDERVSIVQSIYDGSTRSNSEVLDLVYSKNFMSLLTTDRPELDKKLFYSTLLSLVLNRADGFNFFLKKYSSGHLKNNELINMPKKKLIDSYRRYLYSIKDDPTLKNTLKSPLRPEKEEERIRVAQLLKEGLFTDTGLVKLVRENADDFWQYMLPNFKVTFSNEKKQLVNLIYGESGSEIQFVPREYILFDGVHELPKYISIRASNGKIYNLEFKKLVHLSENYASFIQRIEALSLKYKNRKTYTSIEKPVFVY